MRALVWHGKEDIRCDTVTDPCIEHPRDAIVKITSCDLRGLTTHIRYPMASPTEDVLTENRSLSELDVQREFPGLGHRVMSLSAHNIASDSARNELILLAIDALPLRELNPYVPARALSDSDHPKCFPPPAAPVRLTKD